MNQKYDVFISVKRENQTSLQSNSYQLAKMLSDRLRQSGFQVYLSDITITSKNRKTIERVINEAKIMIIVATEINHFTDNDVKYEWQTFLFKENYYDYDCQIYKLVGTFNEKQVPRALRMIQSYSIKDMDSLLRRVENNLSQKVSNDKNEAFNRNVTSPSKIKLFFKRRWIPILCCVSLVIIICMFIYFIFKRNYSTNYIYINDTTLPDDISVNSIVLFGHFEQDGNSENGKEAIQWRVLDKTNNNILLISEFLLDIVKYNEDGNALEHADITWEICSLRNYLNNQFLREAFSEDDQKMILTVKNSNPDFLFQYYNTDETIDEEIHTTEGGNETYDKVFEITTDEAEKYFSSNYNRRATKTFYCRLKNNKNYYGRWWLRSPGKNSHCAAYVDEDGIIERMGEVADYGYIEYGIGNYAMRPAIWIKLK